MYFYFDLKNQKEYFWLFIYICIFRRSFTATEQMLINEGFNRFVIMAPETRAIY